MDTTEIIALAIVAVAVLLAVRYFCKHKGGGGCCKMDCFKTGSKKDFQEKK